MNKTERRFPKTFATVAAATIAALLPAIFFTTRAADGSTSNIRDFATRSYIHGVPFGEAHAFGRAAVPELLSMLNDSTLEEHWTNVVWILGCIGDPSATLPLIDFLNTRTGELSASSFRATLAVLPALGHLARAGDHRATAALIEYTRWTKINRPAQSFSYGRYQGETLRDLLGKTAIQGLGISGTPNTRDVLKGLRARATARPDWRSNLDEAIQFSLRVERETPERIFGVEVGR